MLSGDKRMKFEKIRVPLSIVKALQGKRDPLSRRVAEAAKAETKNWGPELDLSEDEAKWLNDFCERLRSAENAEPKDVSAATKLILRLRDRRQQASAPAESAAAPVARPSSPASLLALDAAMAAFKDDPQPPTPADPQPRVEELPPRRRRRLLPPEARITEVPAEPPLPTSARALVPFGDTIDKPVPQSVVDYMATFLMPQAGKQPSPLLLEARRRIGRSIARLETIADLMTQKHPNKAKVIADAARELRTLLTMS
jgi:hypothetical protein